MFELLNVARHLSLFFVQWKCCWIDFIIFIGFYEREIHAFLNSVAPLSLTNSEESSAPKKPSSIFGKKLNPTSQLEILARKLKTHCAKRSIFMDIWAKMTKKTYMFGSTEGEKSRILAKNSISGKKWWNRISSTKIGLF